LARQHAKPIDAEALAILDALPDWIEEQKPAVAAENAGAEQ
jgi:hypothetical protein